MYPIRFASVLSLALILLVVTGCSRAPEKRPAAGQIVSVLIFRPKTWTEGTAATLNVRLRVHTASDPIGEMLRDAEVPHEIPPIMTLAFLKGDEVVKVFDKVPMAPDC